MSTLKRSLKSSVVLSTLCLAWPAVAQTPPAPGGVAPAPVDLQEDKAAQPAAPAAQPAAPGAQPAAPGAQPAQPGAQAGVQLGAATPAAAPQAAATTAEAKPAAAVSLGSAATTPAQRGVDVGMGGWGMSYHGYFRAPMRFGIGKRELSQRVVPQREDGTAYIPPQSRTTAGTTSAAVFGPTAYKETTIHLPLIPDDQYLSWQHTNHNPTDWAELFLTVGNQIAEGSVSIEGYNFTQASYADPNTNFGVAQGFVHIHPELPWENVRLSAKAGAHWNRYGMAGRYDAGEFDTYLFGRTKTLGGTLRQEVDLGTITLAFEEGLGTRRPDPSQYNTAKFTLLGHLHGFLQYEGLMVGAHFLSAFSQEEDRDGLGCVGSDPDGGAMCTAYWGGTTPTTTAAGAGNAPTVVPTGARAFGVTAIGAEGNVWLPDGRMNIMGLEVKYDAHPFGLIYLGWSVVDAKNALTVAPAVEVISADGGGQFGIGLTNNYLDNPRCNAAGGECSSGGNGTVNTLLFQYEFSLMNLLKGLEDGSRFWGEGMDFVAKLYAMYNQISSKYDPLYDGSWWAFNQYGGVTGNYDPALNAQNRGYWVQQGDNYSKYSKLKYGADFYFHALPVMGVGIKVDHLQPNSKLPEQAFTIVSPRLEFRSTWITRERVTLQYSRYMYHTRECPVTSDPALIDAGAIVPTANFANWPANQRCVQSPSGPRLPDGWGGDQLDAPLGLAWRGAPLAGGNSNQQRPDINVVNISATMWW
jgi:hypothetical protein